MATKASAASTPTDPASLEHRRDRLMDLLKRVTTLEAIVNTACEGNPEVEAAIRRAAHEVARMDERERTVAAVPRALRALREQLA